MMGQGFGAAIARSVITFILAAVAIAFALGVAAMWGLPKLWELVKPLIHEVTK